MSEFYGFNGGDPWGFMATEVLGTLGGILVVFAIINSSLANANASATAATRSVFSMGRAGLLPRSLPPCIQPARHRSTPSTSRSSSPSWWPSPVG